METCGTVQFYDGVAGALRRLEMSIDGCRIASNHRTRKSLDRPVPNGVFGTRSDQRSESTQSIRSRYPGLAHEFNGAVEERSNVVARHHCRCVINIPDAGLDRQGAAAERCRNLPGPLHRASMSANGKRNTSERGGALSRVANRLQRVKAAAGHACCFEWRQ
jgi:hypothetical protein